MYKNEPKVEHGTLKEKQFIKELTNEDKDQNLGIAIEAIEAEVNSYREAGHTQVTSWLE
ncbi:hypothetical protein [Aliikangiella sp. G2MR2-5]|uniref:hypothetical protein n=1 Tax=Aliikangiella sp. G2MR2-5 TaxID=2788943 RepID=UPI0018A96658|nr:hypothetical protein [Aliikangiella sp. G2MR2-5]